jgi:molybdopterin/thiamine biosynthesis adenylyltransferase
MRQQDYSRIEGAVSIELLKKKHILAIGAGGAYSFYDGLARSGIGKLTVLDFDEVEGVNLVRQGYEKADIGKKKVDALGEHLKKVNPNLNYKGITKNFLTMSQQERDELFADVDFFAFLTDSFEAQSQGNLIALMHNKPALWAGYYEKSQCAEIVFTIPGVTPSCFRCGVSPRYEAQNNSQQEIKASSNCNTIFHSQLLDSYIGMIVLAILHNDTTGYEFSNWFGTYWDRNLIQIKVHPQYSHEKGNLFERVFAPTDGRAFTFNAIWQKIEPEVPPKYQLCPDCKGSLLALAKMEKKELSAKNTPRPKGEDQVTPEICSPTQLGTNLQFVKKDGK